jgi:hypothetical protein
MLAWAITDMPESIELDSRLNNRLVLLVLWDQVIRSEGAGAPKEEEKREEAGRETRGVKEENENRDEITEREVRDPILAQEETCDESKVQIGVPDQGQAHFHQPVTEIKGQAKPVTEIKGQTKPVTVKGQAKPVTEIKDQTKPVTVKGQAKPVTEIKGQTKPVTVKGQAKPVTEIKDQTKPVTVKGQAKPVKKIKGQTKPVTVKGQVKPVTVKGQANVHQPATETKGQANVHQSVTETKGILED